MEIGKVTCKIDRKVPMEDKYENRYINLQKRGEPKLFPLGMVQNRGVGREVVLVWTILYSPRNG